ncbi:MAG: hypothetical protein HZB56_19205 [Deltaproteobacteria bacterium]|nr:hypothetical protein [Deltaproteobacteria bacterium]
MDGDTKKALGKVLGELYRLEKKLGLSYPSDETIYGLTRGFEEVLDSELTGHEGVTADEVSRVIEVLNPIWKDKAKLDAFKGYYDIEHDLEQRGITRSKAIKILTMLQARGQFHSVITKMDTSNSPGECRTFKLEV